MSKREILFRGKRIDNGEWMQGWLFYDYDPFYHSQAHDDVPPRTYQIIDGNGHRCNVIPETVGQFTGLLAAKRKTNVEERIFEHDVFRSEKDENEISYIVVMWIEKRAAFYMIPAEHYQILLDNDCSEESGFDWLFQEAALYDFSIDCGLTKVGNIHDNHELLTQP